MDIDYEFLDRRAEFFLGEEFKRFFLPLVAARRESHFGDYLSKGGDEPRVKIRELEDLLEDVAECCIVPDE